MEKYNVTQMLEADGENQDDYANHVITTLTQELEKMNEYSKTAIIEVDSWISGFSAPTHKDYTGKPFMTADVTIKPVEGKNIGGDKIQQLNVTGGLFSAIETMKGLGFYVDFNIVQLPIHCQDKDDPKPFEIQMTFYSEF
jgi:hypothetical protein|tara:strand:+ start:126 stop:545 length:420 start_codon:yes stop_codon:yes gene_type:complete